MAGVGQAGAQLEQALVASGGRRQAAAVQQRHLQDQGAHLGAHVIGVAFQLAGFQQQRPQPGREVGIGVGRHGPGVYSREACPARQDGPGEAIGRRALRR